MACPKCGSETAAILYSLRLVDHRAITPDGADETLELEIIVGRPKTGVCEECKKRIPLPP